MILREFLETLELAVNSKTLYVNGAFGAPASASNKKRYATRPANAKRVDSINKASADTFFFDCVCLIKGILWGWCADKSKTYGGAKYCSNGVPDIGEAAMIEKCSKVSTDFSKIEAGEIVYMNGHCGIYKGDGEVIESSPSWKNGVQITKLADRKWLKHGFLPYVEYESKAEPVKVESERIYTVVKGDSLWRIASKELGAGARWPEILKLNGLTSACIHIGQKLKLPIK